MNSYITENIDNIMADEDANAISVITKIKSGILQNVNKDQLQKFLFQLIQTSPCVNFYDMKSLGRFSIDRPSIEVVMDLEESNKVYRKTVAYRSGENIKTILENRSAIIRAEVTEPFVEILPEILERIVQEAKGEYQRENDKYRYKEWVDKILEGKDIKDIKERTLDIIEDNIDVATYRYLISSISSITFPDKKDRYEEYNSDTYAVIEFMI